MPSTEARSQDLLAMVRLALDEFEAVPLDASVRRAIRIANLLNETKIAIRLSLELKPKGGHPPSNADDARRLMSEPELWGEAGGLANQAVEEWIADRDHNGLVMTHSLTELDFWHEERMPLSSDEMSLEQWKFDLTFREKRTEIIARARHRTFTALCSWERQLTFASTQEAALERLNRRVDEMLTQHAPDILNRFNSAFRRLHEAVDRNEGGASEELSQAVSSCRRILKSVVDAVNPANPDSGNSADGHSLTDDAYKNRLVEFLKRRTTSSTYRSALSRSGETLFTRFTAVDALASKGVHASIARDEAEFCALHTYLLAGEVLLLHQDLVAEGG